MLLLLLLTGAVLLTIAMLLLRAWRSQWLQMWTANLAQAAVVLRAAPEHATVCNQHKKARWALVVLR
jgi:hypothetical protein